MTTQDQGETVLTAADTIQNPYWETVINQIPGDTLGNWRDPEAFTPSSYGMTWTGNGFDEANCFPTREALVRQFSWAIPNPATLDWLVQHLGNRSVVEIGAGRGYWAWMLNQMGVKVTAFDAAPPDQAENWFVHEHEDAVCTYTQQDVDAWHKRWDPLLANEGRESDLGLALPPPPKPPVVGAQFAGRRVVPGSRASTYHEVIQGGPEVLKDFAHSALFLCWPTYDDPFAVEAVRAYAGDLIVYCGEGEGGCTGDDALYQELATSWQEVADNWSIHTRWSGVNDYIQIYRRA